MKTRIALVGASIRATAFVKALLRDYSENWEIVGVMDTDTGKIRGFQEYLGLNVPAFTDFETLCDSTGPDRLLISTIDVFHEKYIVKAMDRKIGVISEKPLCINAAQCRSILAARRRNPEIFAVTSHNARYDSLTQTLKKLVDDGTIGKVLSMEYHEMLDHVHGTSYFRRWNSRRKYSNGLELHKASHHFDKINYLLNSRAATVSASGKLTHYGANAPHRFSGERCSACPHLDECEYAVRYHEEKGNIVTYTTFYKYRTDPASYTPDLCVFSPEIDIEDNFSASVEYENGTFCSYSLCAHANCEGEQIILEGETGRLEAKSVFYRKQDSGDIHDTAISMEKTIRLIRFGHGSPENIPVPEITGSHGGADAVIFRKFFGGGNDPLPTLEDGIQAVLTGSAVVESIRTGRKIDVQKLLVSDPEDNKRV